MSRVLSPFRPVAAVIASLVLAGCATGPLSPDLAMETGQAGATPTFDVLYVTDRMPGPVSAQGLSYTAGRAPFISFGDAKLAPTRAGLGDSDLSVVQVNEIGQFPPSPYPLEARPKGPQRASEVVRAHENAAKALQTAVESRLATSRRKELVIFIHGYHNSFDDALESTTDICRNLHNDFVCVALSWPADGTKGAFLGYNVDRESGEFAVPDVKKAIRILADTKGVERVHIIAHSRGTAVLASAVQQLGIETYVSRTSISERYKIANLILFAPDIDMDVATSKMFGIVSDPDLPFGNKSAPDTTFPKQGPIHLTVYSSPNDKALDISALLFGSSSRLGQASFDKMPKDKFVGLAWNASRKETFADFIVYEGKPGGGIGHSYFLSDKMVRADFAALIRDGKAAGEPGRMLVELRRPFWRIGVPKAPAATDGQAGGEMLAAATVQ